MKKTFLLIQAAFIAACMLFTALQAQEALDGQEVIAKGLGAIINGDEAKAADDALGSALRNAVEQVVGTMIESSTLIQNYQVVEDRIYNRTQGYVQTYEVLSQTKRGDNILETTIRAVVKKGNLEEDLAAIGLLLSRKNKPRMMILVDERNMHHHYFYYNVDLNTSATEITNKFLEKGFKFVDAAVIKNKLNKDAVMAAISGDAASAQVIARESGAEVLLIGSAVSRAARASSGVIRDAGMVSCQASLNLRAVRADDGSIIATASRQAAAVHVDQIAGGTQALIKASGMAAEELIGKILKVWETDVYSGATVQVRVLNIPSFNDLIRFKNMIQTYARGVQNIYQRDYSGGAALLDIELKGNANQLAEELAVKSFDPYNVDIVNVSQNTIVLKLGMTASQ